MSRQTELKEYQMTVRAVNDMGVLSRISILMRKYSVFIEKIHAEPIDSSEKFSDIIITVKGKEKNFDTAMKKIERLIPVLSVNYAKLPN